MEIQTKINSLNALLPQQVPFVMAQVTDLKKPCARNARRDEFAKQICASIAKSRLGSDSRHGLLLWHK